MEGGAFVYIAEADHAVKVGLTIDLAGRMRELGRATGLHVDLIRSWPIADRSSAWQIEQGAHWLLRDTRLNGEWFRCHPFEAVDAVEQARRWRAIYYAGLMDDGEAWLESLRERTAA